jgi:hypothetical protein
MICNRWVKEPIRNVRGFFFEDTIGELEDKKMLALIGLKTGFAQLFRVIESHGGIL